MPTYTTYTSRIPEIVAELGSELPGVVKEAADEFVAIARNRARVRTGAMRDGIHAEETGAFAVDVVADMYYTIFNEYGTIYMSAQPMFGPAAEIVGPRFTSQCELVLKRTVEG